jgi:hypothetical protein
MKKHPWQSGQYYGYSLVAVLFSSFKPEALLAVALDEVVCHRFEGDDEYRDSDE